MGICARSASPEPACRGAHRHLILPQGLRASPHKSLQDELAAAPDRYDCSRSKLSQDNSAVSGSKGSLADYYYAGTHLVHEYPTLHQCACCAVSLSLVTSTAANLTPSKAQPECLQRINHSQGVPHWGTAEALSLTTLHPRLCS